MSAQNNNQSPSNKSSPSKLQNFADNIDKLSMQIEKKYDSRKQKKIRRKQQLNQLYDAIQQKSNVLVSKLQDISRKPTIVVTVSKIQPEIPEGFPKNYNIQIVYEDVIITGNQKFVDFDENVVDQRFILPLLSSESAKLQIWIAQEEPSLYDRAIINLEVDIEAAIEDSNYQNEICFDSNSGLSVLYKVQLQGIGFQAWLKNIKSLKEVQEQRRKGRKQLQIKQQKTRERIEEKKQKFNNKFRQSESAKGTKEYSLKGIQQILDVLDD